MAARAFLTITETRSRDLQRPEEPDQLPTPTAPLDEAEKGDRQAVLKS
jgi:hypothetical protein